MNKYTILDFIFKLSNESWDGVFNNNDVNLMFNSFLNTYLKIFYFSFPLIRSKSRNYSNNWITLGIKISCKQKRELFLLTRNINNSALKPHYKAYCKILVKVIKEAKRMTMNKRILKSNNKTKTTSNIISELLGKQHHTQETQKLTTEGTHLTIQQDIANAFNNYFSTITDKTNSDSQENMRHGNPHTYCYFDHSAGDSYPLMVFKTFSTQEITSIIKSIKTKNSSSYDEISTKLLKISANNICSPLTYICNKSVSTGIFPERLKYSIIKPLYKKGDKTDPANYEPI